MYNMVKGKLRCQEPRINEHEYENGHERKEKMYDLVKTVVGGQRGLTSTTPDYG